MSGFTLTPTNPVTDLVRPPAGKYRHILGDGTNGLLNLALYRMDSSGTCTLLQPSAYTAEEAQDAVGLLLTDSPQLDFTYNDAGNAETVRFLVPVQATVVAASKVYAASDIGKYFRRSNSGASMTDTLPTLTSADNGFQIKVQNLETVAGINITFTGAGGEIIGELAATSYTLKPGCRQTFVWDGNRLAWSFDAGNGNLLKTYTGAAVGDILTFSDATVVTAAKATSRQIAQAQNDFLGQVNILDFGADRTGATSSATALTNALAALPNGGVVYFPPGTYNLGNVAFLLATAHVTLRGAARYNTNITTTSTTEDIIQIGQYYNVIEDLTFIGPGTGENPTKTAGFGINGAGSGFPANTEVHRCTFFYMYSAINLANSLMNVDDIEVKFFKGVGITVNHNSDHQIDKVIMNNNASFLPTGGAGIRVLATASLQMQSLNIISSNFALDIAPAVGVTTPSIKAVNCFFDTSAVGLNMTSAGSMLRSEFTNCWFSSMTVAGIRLQPTTAGGVNGVTFTNCDIYQNVGGTTAGVDTNTNVGKWKMLGCSIAGWTTGINLVAGTAHYPTILSNTIGAVSAFGVNGTGIAVGAGAFAGFTIQSNDMVDNTTPATIGAFTAADYKKCRILDNAGINPRTITTPAVPATTVVTTNTTGARVMVVVKWGATAPTAVAINGTNTVLPLLNQVVTYILEPGGTIAFTGVVPTWTWIGL